VTRILPSRVVAAIDEIYPWSAASGLSGSLGPDNSIYFGAIVRLIEQIPAECLPIDAAERTAFFTALGMLQAALVQWVGIGRDGSGPRIGPHPAFANRGGDPVSVLRRLLSRCPDIAPAAATHELTFVADAALRNALRTDLSSTRRLAGEGEHKAATVLAGSIIEALLLDALSSVSVADRNQALAAWQQRSKRPGEDAPGKLPPSLDRWRLVDLVWISLCAGVISEEAAALADVARDFRNLIHPGRTRTSIPCDEGTALAAVGAALRIANELEARSGRRVSRP
jgi:hypothetical protein